MAWCRNAAVRSLNVPALHVGAPSAAAAVFISRSLSTRSFASMSISSAATQSLKEAVKTDKAPAALGPYSQAIKTNNMVFLSGVLGLIPETGKFVSDCVEEQTEQANICFEHLLNMHELYTNTLEVTQKSSGQVMKNMGEILKASGASYSSVVKTTIMYAFLASSFFILLTIRLADLNDFKKVNEVYDREETTKEKWGLLQLAKAQNFPSPPPARSTYQVAALPLNAKVEIECIAVLQSP
ncbi:hypothetical protein Leryth_010122 [Lithospermum erythrorhizon]|nr:hypothetical protein Leryth_010122 [Lithospermum erythrorhizon]